MMLTYVTVPARIVGIEGYRFTCEFTQPLHPAVLRKVFAIAERVFGKGEKPQVPSWTASVGLVARHAPGWLLNGLACWLVALCFDPSAPFFIVMFAGIVLTGVFASNIAGQWALRQGAKILHQIPIVKSIYSSVKQVSDTLFSSSGNAFREAVLVQYPREGSWTIAFVTGKPGGEAAQHLHDGYLSLYVPTTPNPTSGFFLMVPRTDVIALAMSVDEALKYIISMGVVAPPLHLTVQARNPQANSEPARNQPG